MLAIEAKLSSELEIDSSLLPIFSKIPDHPLKVNGREGRVDWQMIDGIWRIFFQPKVLA